MDTKKILHVFLAVLFVTATVVASGCAQKTGRTTTQADQTDWEWVPRVWVEDNSSRAVEQAFFSILQLEVIASCK